jgi:hypothetical protein
VVGFSVYLTLKPVSILGYDGNSLAESLSRASDYGAAECSEKAERWLCRIELDQGSGYGASYSIRADDDGCWDARPIAPRSLDPQSGCVNLFDLIGLSPGSLAPRPRR